MVKTGKNGRYKVIQGLYKVNKALNGALDTIMEIEKELEDIAKTREEDAKN